MKRLWSRIKSFFTTPVEEPVPEQQVVEVHRLSKEAYEQLVSRLPSIGLPRNAEEASYLVGIQLVLAELRKGYVIG